jgi:hypothetical protein
MKKANAQKRAVVTLPPAIQLDPSAYPDIYAIRVLPGPIPQHGVTRAQG